MITLYEGYNLDVRSLFGTTPALVLKTLYDLSSYGWKAKPSLGGRQKKPIYLRGHSDSSSWVKLNYPSLCHQVGGISETTAERTIQLLEAIGVVVTELNGCHRDNMTNMYCVDVTLIEWWRKAQQNDAAGVKKTFLAIKKCIHFRAEIPRNISPIYEDFLNQYTKYTEKANIPRFNYTKDRRGSNPAYHMIKEKSVAVSLPVENATLTIPNIEAFQTSETSQWTVHNKTKSKAFNTKSKANSTSQSLCVADESCKQNTTKHQEKDKTSSSFIESDFSENKNSVDIENQKIETTKVSEQEIVTYIPKPVFKAKPQVVLGTVSICGVKVDFSNSKEKFLLKQKKRDFMQEEYPQAYLFAERNIHECIEDHKEEGLDYRTSEVYLACKKAKRMIKEDTRQKLIQQGYKVV